jgi:hypothetical protein
VAAAAAGATRLRLPSLALNPITLASAPSAGPRVPSVRRELHQAQSHGLL